MNQQLIESIISTLENELFNFEQQRYICETKIEDAEATTNNADADKHLQNERRMAVNTIAMLDRQIEVRRNRVAQLTAQLPAAPQPREIVAPDTETAPVPPETANANKMPDLVKD